MQIFRIRRRNQKQTRDWRDPDTYAPRKYRKPPNSRPQQTDNGTVRQNSNNIEAPYNSPGRLDDYNEYPTLRQQDTEPGLRRTGYRQRTRSYEEDPQDTSYRYHNDTADERNAPQQRNFVQNRGFYLIKRSNFKVLKVF